MFQTGYKGYTTLAKGLSYNGGFCKWYYIDRKQILSFPVINPLTQYLSDEPTIAGSWCGPVWVPNDQLGFEEIIKRDKVGHYYNYKVSGFQPGDDRINLENMAHFELVVVGKMRAGGMHLILGTIDNGLSFDADYKSVGHTSAGSEFVFSGAFLHKALILPSFQGSNVIVPPVTEGNTGGNTGGDDSGSGSGGTGSGQSVEPEIIAYSTEDVITIAWTLDRKNRFGTFPTIEVWYTEDGVLRLNANAVITVNAFPPDTTLFTITINAPGPGIVVIK